MLIFLGKPENAKKQVLVGCYNIHPDLRSGVQSIAIRTTMVFGSLCVYKTPWETHFVRLTHLSGHQRAIGQNGQNAQSSGKSNFFHLSPDLSGMDTGPNRPPWDPFRSPKLPVSTPDCDRYHRGTVGACATLESGMSLFQLPGGSNRLPYWSCIKLYVAFVCATA